MNRRSRLVWLVVIACTVGLFFGGRALLRRHARNKAATVFARFSRCLVGSEPLGNETPGKRLRRIELGLLERKLGNAPAAADAEWPARCDRYAHNLDRALPDAFHGNVVAFLAVERSALTLRMAPIGDLAKASVRVLDDLDYRKGGVTLHGVYLFARGRFAVLVANIMRGASVFRLDSTGKLERVVLDPE